LTSVAFFMVALDALVVITALPAIHQEIGGSLSTLDWAVNAYLLVFAAGIVTAAALGDRLGRRRCYTLGLVVFAAASAACALAPTAPILIAARAVQGAGAAIVTPLSLTILTGSFPAQRRGGIVGVWAGIAAAGGPLVGGAVTQGLSWHWIFWVNVPVGLVAAALSAVRLTESRGPATRLDLPGVGLVSVGSLGLAWGLVRAGDAGWGSIEVVAALGVGILALAGFAVWETRTSNPMLPPGLFRNSGFAGAIATAFLVIGASTSAAFLVSQYFQFGLGYSLLGTLRFLPWTGAPLFVAPRRRHGRGQDRATAADGGRDAAPRHGARLDRADRLDHGRVPRPRARPDHRRYRTFNGPADHGGGGARRRAPTGHGQGVRGQQHDAALRRRLRRRGRLRDVRHQRTPGHSGRRHRRLPPSPGRLRRTVPGRRGQRTARQPPSATYAGRRHAEAVRSTGHDTVGIRRPGTSAAAGTAPGVLDAEIDAWGRRHL
jgi:MFS family permease